MPDDDDDEDEDWSGATLDTSQVTVSRLYVKNILCLCILVVDEQYNFNQQDKVLRSSGFTDELTLLYYCALVSSREMKKERYTLDLQRDI